MTDDGVASLAAKGSITVIDPNGTQVSDLGLAHLRKCKDLRMLAIVFAKVTKDGLDAMRKQFPKCRIITTSYIVSRQAWNARRYEP